MGNLFGLFHIGNSGLGASQVGIQTAGQNLANVQTPGYHRQQVVLSPNESIKLQRYTLGTGVDVVSTRQVIDRALTGRRRSAGGEAAAFEARSSILARADAIFGDLEESGLSPALDQLFDSFSALATRPQDGATRSQVLAAAQSFVSEVNRYGEQLRTARTELNENVQVGVEEVNRLARQVADLNNQLRHDQQPSNEVLDQRAAALDQLVEWTGARVNERPDGVVDVSLPSGFALVSADQAYALRTGNDPQGLAQVYGSEAAGEQQISARFTGGKLGGILAARDTDLGATESELDALVFATANAINGVHAAGYGLDGLNGRNLFTAPGAVAGAARGLSVDAQVATDPRAIAAASDPTRVPGDNQAALALAALGTAASVNGQTPSAGLRGLLSAFADRANSAATRAEATGAASTRLEALEQSVSGVSIDEEMVSLLAYRQAYSASAQVIRTADELVQEVLSLKR